MLSLPALVGSATPHAARGRSTHATPASGRTAAEAERLEVRERETADGASDVAERVAAGVAIGVGVGRGADPEPVEHDDRGAAAHGRGVVCT